MFNLRRREFIALLGSTAAWPLAVRAQQLRPVIGFLIPTSTDMQSDRLHALRQGLKETGFVEGENLAIEYRWAEGQYDRLPVLATELVNHPVAVIITVGGTPTALAAKSATETIPIVFVVGSDPVQIGLVKSLARPSGNVTGVTVLDVELIAKGFELLHELIPGATRIGVLVNPKNLLVDAQTRVAQIAARQLGVRLLMVNASGESEIETAFTTVVDQQASALLVTSDTLFHGTVDNQLSGLAARHAVPTVCQYPQFTAAGGLMGYGANLADAFRLGGGYVGRILKGAKPADLPVQQATKVELAINLKTARELGLTVPPSLLARADKVIE
jgi:putative ABC transport system substrate-binding protein